MSSIRSAAALAALIVVGALATGCASAAAPGAAGTPDAAPTETEPAAPAPADAADRGPVELQRLTAAIDECALLGVEMDPRTRTPEGTCVGDALTMDLLFELPDQASLEMEDVEGVAAHFEEHDDWCFATLPVSEDRSMMIENANGRGPCAGVREAVERVVTVLRDDPESAMLSDPVERLTACDVVETAGFAPVADDLLWCGSEGADWRLNRYFAVTEGPLLESTSTVDIEGTEVGIVHYDEGQDVCVASWTGAKYEQVGTWSSYNLELPGACDPAIEEIAAKLVPASLTAKPADVDLSTYLLPAS